MEHPTQPNAQRLPVDRGSRLWVVGRTVACCLGFEARRWRASHLNQRPTPWAAPLPPPLVVPPRPQPQRAPPAALRPGRAVGTARQPTTASNHVPRKQGTRPETDRKLRAEGSRDGRRATSSTSGGCDLLGQRWLRPPQPAAY